MATAVELQGSPLIAPLLPEASWLWRIESVACLTVFLRMYKLASGSSRGMSIGWQTA
jgi:hypothetical protein